MGLSREGMGRVGFVCVCLEARHAKSDAKCCFIRLSLIRVN